jgi:hypothetical protein
MGDPLISVFTLAREPHSTRGLLKGLDQREVVLSYDVTYPDTNSVKYL